MFEKMFEKMLRKALKEKRSTMVCSTEMLYARKMLQISVFEDSTKNCILIPRKPGSED